MIDRTKRDYIATYKVLGKSFEEVHKGVYIFRNDKDETAQIKAERLLQLKSSNYPNWRWIKVLEIERA